MSTTAMYYAQAYLQGGGTSAKLRQGRDILHQMPEVWDAFLNPAISIREKEQVLHRCCFWEEDTLEKRFFTLLLKKDRMELLDDIVQQVHEQELAQSGGAVCVWTCARPPHPEDIERMESVLCQKHHLNHIEFVIREDASLLGGFRLELQGMTYEKSIQGGLAQLAKKLGERGTL